MMNIHGLSTMLAWAFLASGAMGQATFTANDIPPIHLGKSAPERLRHGFQSGGISLEADTGKVRLDWKASAVENQEPDYSLLWNGQNQRGNHRVTLADQTFQASFFPTASCVISHDAILVGGVTRFGKTVIEKWTLSWPAIMPAVTTPVGGGVTSVSPVLVGRSSKERIYEDDQPGQHLPRSLVVIRKEFAEPSDVLTQFDDSSDVYAVPLSGGPAVLIASRSTYGATLGIVSGLIGKFQTGLWFGDHQTEGYTYVLIRSVAGRKPVTPYIVFPYVVILKDADRDGVLDGVTQTTQTGFYSAPEGWSDLGNYHEWWKN